MENMEINLIKKFMKKLSNSNRECVHRMFIKYNPQTIEELIVLAMKCLEDKGGMSENDFKKHISELENFQDKIIKEIEELKDLLAATKKRKNKRDNPPKHPPKR